MYESGNLWASRLVREVSVMSSAWWSVADGDCWVQHTGYNGACVKGRVGWEGGEGRGGVGEGAVGAVLNERAL